MRDSEYQRSRSRSPARGGFEDRRGSGNYHRTRTDSRFNDYRRDDNDYRRDNSDYRRDNSDYRRDSRGSRDSRGGSTDNRRYNNTSSHSSNRGSRRSSDLGSRLGGVGVGVGSSSSNSSGSAGGVGARGRQPELAHYPPRVEGASYSDKMNRNYSNSVFVGNLPYDCEARDLEDYFASVGKVIRADIVTNRGRHRGMGTVEFLTRESVDDAIKNLDHSTFMDREIFVREDNPPPSSVLNEMSRQRERARDSGDRSGERSGRRFEDSRIGDRFDDNRGDRFRDRERDDRYNHEKSNSYTNNGQTHNSNSASGNSNSNSSGSSGNSRQTEGVEVFIANLPFSINWQALKDMFKKFGEVTRADVSLDNMHRSRGFGTVYFKTVSEAEESIKYYAGLEMEGRKLDCKKGRYGWKSTYAMNEESSSTDNKDNIADDNMNISEDDNSRVIDDFNDDGVNSPFVENASPNGEKSNIVYVSNLPLSTAQSDLYDLFDTIGKVTKAELKYVNREVNGDAVVKYTDIESAEICISRLDKYVYGGCELNISFAQYKENESTAASAAAAAVVGNED